MPVETWIAALAAAAAFGLFMAVLAWGWWYTRESRPRFPRI